MSETENIKVSNGLRNALVRTQAALIAQGKIDVQEARERKTLRHLALFFENADAETPLTFASDVAVTSRLSDMRSAVQILRTLTSGEFSDFKEGGRIMFANIIQFSKNPHIKDIGSENSLETLVSTHKNEIYALAKLTPGMEHMAWAPGMEVLPRR